VKRTSVLSEDFCFQGKVVVHKNSYIPVQYRVAIQLHKTAEIKAARFLLA
jgi:hypothetical protein